MRDHQHPAFFWLVVLLSVVYAGFLIFGIDVMVTYYGLVKDAGWSLRATGDGWYVSDVDVDGPAAGQVEVGDRLLALNGNERAAVLGVFRFRNVAGGDTYRVDFERNGR